MKLRGYCLEICYFKIFVIMKCEKRIQIVKNSPFAHLLPPLDSIAVSVFAVDIELTNTESESEQIQITI